MRRLVLLLIAIAAMPMTAAAQIPAGCHLITPEERAALALRDTAISASGFFCDADKVLLFGSCTSDPLPILLARYTPGTLSAQEGRRGVTKLNPEFACRLSRFLTTYPVCIVSGWRSNETQQKLWDEALIKYGSETEARKYVAPPGKSRHNTGLAADLCTLSPQAKAALGGFQLYQRLEYEPWHIEGIGITETETGVTSEPTWVPNGTSNPSGATSLYTNQATGGSWLSNIASLYSLASGLSSFFMAGTSGSAGEPQYVVTRNSNTLYVTLAAAGATTTVSMADILLLALQGSDAPTIVFTNSSSTITVTPETLAAMLTGTTTPAAEQPLSAEEQLRTLMLQVVGLLQELVRRLSALVS